MVFGIGWRYEAALRELGCTRHDQMRALVPEDVVAHFRSHKMYISPAVVRSWKLHARAYAEGLPVLSAEREPLPKLGRYIALDLEWGLDDAIFLAGLGIVDNGEVEHMSFWADSPDEEPVVLASLARALDDHPDLPVVTWNGRGADLPHLAKRAAAVAGAGGLVPALGPRHFDLYMWAQAYLRLPGPSLTLKEVARAFGFRASSGLSGGDDAMMVYYQYRRSADPALRDQLVAYNRDDISSLVSVAARLAEMDNCGAPSPGDPWRVV